MLVAASLTGCAEFCESENRPESDPAIVARFGGEWKVDRQIFAREKSESLQTGNASGELVGHCARLRSDELKMELIFGIRPNGEYALIDLNASRSGLLVGKIDEEDEDDGEGEKEKALQLKFGKGVRGKIRFLSADSIEISYFQEHDGKQRLLEKILLKRP